MFQPSKIPKFSNFTKEKRLDRDIFDKKKEIQEIPEGPVLDTNQISVERLADVEVTLEGNSNHTVNTA